MKELIQWSQKEFQDLPWRVNRTLYRTLVSEIMLQQTTVATVLKHFETFVRKYPNVESLANAGDDELLMSWKGLGYYRRVKNLKKACQYFAQEFQGKIPEDYHMLIKAPGIGEYTANALLSIGANQRALAIDANLERVLSRLYAIEAPKGPKLQKEIATRFRSNLIAKEMDEHGARAYNEALMDLGRNWCQARRINCLMCPLSSKCLANKQGTREEFPKTTEKKKQSFELELLRIVCIEKNKILLIEKKEREWLSGQLEIPTFILSCEDEKLTQYPRADFSLEVKKSLSFKSAITKYKITNQVLLSSYRECQKLMGDRVSQYRWYSFDPQRLNLSTASIKALNLANEKSREEK